MFSQEKQLGELRRLKEEINNERVHVEQSQQLLEKKFEEARRILKEEINPRNTCRSKLQNFHSSFWNRNQPSPSVDVTCEEQGTQKSDVRLSGSCNCCQR